MRRILRAVPVLALASALFALLVAPAAAQLAKKPDLVVSSSAEPPDFIAAEDGGDFLLSFTVDNQGRARARRTTLARAYLSIGRVMSADDRRRRVGSRRVSPLSVGKSTTRRLIVRVPREFRTGEYFLIVCADVRNVVDELNDRANCHVSGQRLRIAPATERVGPPGSRGEPGPPGPGGAAQLVIPRKVLNLGTATIIGENNAANSADGGSSFVDNRGPGDNEGSTEQLDLLEVGGVRIRALCRSTTNGDDELPGYDADEDGFLGVENDFDTDEDGDEAKILLYLDRPDGNFSFAGPHGKRFNINAGFGPTRTSAAADPGPGGQNGLGGGDSGGEGKHMALATSADPEGRIRGDADDTDPSIGEDEDDDPYDPQDDWEHAFRNGSIYVATSSGTEFILNAYVGIGVLGTAANQCTFGGTVTVVNR